MRISTILTGGALLLALHAAGVGAQTDGNANGFGGEQSAAGARAVALGRVDLAADGGLFGGWANPAVLPRAPELMAGYRNNQLPVDGYVHGIGLAWSSLRLRLGWVHAGSFMDLPTVSPPDFDPDGSTYRITEQTDVLGGSYVFDTDLADGRSHLALVTGIAARFYATKVGDMSGSASDFDLGLTLRYLRDGDGGWIGARGSAMVRNLTGAAYVLDEREIPLPHHVGLGLAFEGGRDLGWGHGNDLNWLLAYTHRRQIRNNLGNPDDSHHVGLEIGFIESIDLRGGYNIPGVGGGELSYGLGLDSRELFRSRFSVALDWGQYDAGDLGGWRHVFAISGFFTPVIP